MTATVHPLPVRTHAIVSEVHYDSVAGEWTIVATERELLTLANPDALPDYVRDALRAFLKGAAA